MKTFIFFIFFTLISIIVYANEVEVIELHETKTLDQMVLDNSTELLELNTSTDNEEEKNEPVDPYIDFIHTTEPSFTSLAIACLEKCLTPK